MPLYESGAQYLQRNDSMSLFLSLDVFILENKLFSRIESGSTNNFGNRGNNLYSLVHGDSIQVQQFQLDDFSNHKPNQALVQIHILTQKQVHKKSQSLQRNECLKEVTKAYLGFQLFRNLFFIIIFRMVQILFYVLQQRNFFIRNYFFQGKVSKTNLTQLFYLFINHKQFYIIMDSINIKNKENIQVQNQLLERLSSRYKPEQLYQIGPNSLEIARANIKNNLIKNLTRAHQQQGRGLQGQFLSANFSRIAKIYKKEAKVEELFNRKKRKINSRVRKVLQIIGQDEELIDKDLKVLSLCKEKIKKEPPTQAKQK